MPPWPIAVSTELAARLEPDVALSDGPGGLVLRCRERASGRLVVFKHSRAAQLGDPVLNQRFVREGRTLARLEHRGVMHVLECGEDNGARYLILEYLDGPDLAQVVGARGALAVADAVRVVAGLLDALAAVHREGILHRDLKPANAMLVAGRGPVLIDFGIARTLLDSQALTASGVMVGTPAYLAPEIILGQPADRGSDLYSLALVLHFLLIGRDTFARPVVLDALQAQLDDAPEPIPRGSDALKALVARWLQKDAAGRPAPDALAWKADLERAAGY